MVQDSMGSALAFLKIAEILDLSFLADRTTAHPCKTNNAGQVLTEYLDQNLNLY